MTGGGGLKNTCIILKQLEMFVFFQKLLAVTH